MILHAVALQQTDDNEYSSKCKDIFGSNYTVVCYLAKRIISIISEISMWLTVEN